MKLVGDPVQWLAKGLTDLPILSFDKTSSGW